MMNEVFDGRGGRYGNAPDCPQQLRLLGMPVELESEAAQESHEAIRTMTTAVRIPATAPTQGRE